MPAFLMNRRVLILLGDLSGSLAAIVWIWSDWWVAPMGFSVYHSRGDVWLPTPPKAAKFFHDMVMTGNLAYIILFFVISALLWLRLSRQQARISERSSPFLATAFYGGNSSLAVKYGALLSSAILSPYFYSYLRHFHFQKLLMILPFIGLRGLRICLGFLITCAVFSAAILLAHVFLHWPMRSPRMVTA